MDEQAGSAEEQKSNLNPLLVIVVLIIIVAVGVMLWLGNGKNNNQAAKTAITVAPTIVISPTAVLSATVSATNVKDFIVEGGSFYFKPSVIKIKKGAVVKITFNSVGGTHNFVLDEFKIKTEVLASSKSAVVNFTANKIGTFEYYCSVGNHRKMGMTGKLIVE
ncbi:cupredoxin domain-containing protein [Candidatus Roizmanbacteria bacterium]|nr:cupredoxin domain-containing protein [Candidatus Roizmanbacteria bacterium]